MNGFDTSKLQYYVNDELIGDMESATVIYEPEETEVPKFRFQKEWTVSFNHAQLPYKAMSPYLRMFFKQIKRNGKIYW